MVFRLFPFVIALVVTKCVSMPFSKVNVSQLASNTMDQTTSIMFFLLFTNFIKKNT
jgi:hypothetical protein